MSSESDGLARISRALSMADFEAIWYGLFSENAPPRLQDDIHLLRAAACGQDHALLAAGPRIECDALLQIAREHVNALNSVYALARELPAMYFAFLPSDDFLFVRPVKAVMPEWLERQDSSGLLLFAVRGPRAATLAISDELNRLIDERM